MRHGRRYRPFTLAVAVAAIAVLAAACGSTTSGHSSAANPGKGKATGPITWWVPSPSPTPGTLHAAAAAFTKQTGITVNVETTPWATYLTKITTAVTSGHGPDVIEIGNTWAATLARSSGLMPWTPAMFKAIGGESQFVKTSMSVTGLPGKAPVSVPFLGQTWLLEYNKQMFAAAGISSPPTTWSQFYADAKKLSDPAKGVYGVATAVGAPTADETWDWVIFRQYGGRYYSASSQQPDVNSAVDASTLAKYVQWVYPDKIINPALVSDSTGTLDTTEFERGQAAMLLTQDPQQAVTDPGKYGIGYVPLPSPTPSGGAKVMSHVAGENLAIFKNSTHLAADLKFIKFLTSPVEQETINKGMYELPVTTAGLKTPYFQTPAEKTFGHVLTTYARPMPTEASSANLQTQMGNATISLFREDIKNHGVTMSQVRSALTQAQQTVLASGG